jgi:hypothetical protein
LKTNPSLGLFPNKRTSFTTVRVCDYSYTPVDPTDDLTFWTVQEYAAAPVLVGTVWNPNWGTWICKIPPY